MKFMVQEFGELILNGILLSFYMPLGMSLCPTCLRFQSFLESPSMLGTLRTGFPELLMKTL